MKLLKKLAAILIAGCMALSLAACSDTTWVYDFGGEKIPAALYIAYTMQAYRSIYSQDDYDSAITDMMEQTIEGQSAKDWIEQEARESCARYVAIANKCAELGVTLTEEEEAEVDSVLEANWAYLGANYEENGVSRETFRKMLKSSSLQSKLFTSYYDKGGVEEVPTEDLTAHFKENFATVNLFRLPYFTNEDTDEKKQDNEETLARAEEYVKQLNEGTSYGEVYDGYRHFVMGTTHDDGDETDTISPDEDTLTWVKKANDPNYSQRVIDVIFNEMKPEGEAKYIVDDENGYCYIVKRYDTAKAEKNFDDMRTAVLYDVKGDDFEELLDSLASELSVTVNDAAVRRYTPEHIDPNAGADA